MDCATSPSPATAAVLRTLALVGHPNVGKSVLFHRLTGTYVTVSNYPGTTVEVSRATPRFDREASLLDTPGVLALPSRSDDERATMRALLNEDMRTLIQVGDAKNLRRTLNLTALLAELGVPMVMALNMTDEAKARGVTVDAGAASKLRADGKSLLPIGMLSVVGEFSRGDVIAVRETSGAEIARGLANYSSFEARLICRKPSAELERVLGYVAEPEMVHRDNLVITR